MRKPDYASLPRAFREDYVRFAVLRLIGSAVTVGAGIALCFVVDFSALKYPAAGRVLVLAAAVVLASLLFGFHRFFRPAWTGEITELDCGYKVVSGDRGRSEKQMMVDLTVDRGEKKPYGIRLFREEGVTHGKKINVFQREAPYKVGDTLLFLPGFRYPARIDVKDAGETLDPKFVCPFCGAIASLSKTNCPTCGRTVLG